MPKCRRKRLPLEGHKFGRLTVVKKASTRKGNTRWWTECECGGKKLAYTSSLRAGLTKSCGCLQAEYIANASNGYNKTRLHRIWKGMVDRAPVTDPEVLKIYKGKGTHDPAWDDFLMFRDWAISVGLVA